VDRHTPALQISLGHRVLYLRGKEESGSACLVGSGRVQSSPGTATNYLSLELDGLLLAHIAQRALLDHQSHHLVQSVCGRHSGQFGVGVIGRRDFDNVGGDQIDSLQAADDGA